ncbi:uncharacterized protein TNCT_437881, partial [Trichonephila clavata]
FIPVQHAINIKDIPQSKTAFGGVTDSREITLPYIKRNWPQIASFKPGEFNVKHPFETELHEITAPQLHTRIGFVKKLEREMDKNGPELNYQHEEVS